MIRHRYLVSITNEPRVYSLFYIVNVLPNLLMADNPRIKSSEPKSRKYGGLWDEVKINLKPTMKVRVKERED